MESLNRTLFNSGFRPANLQIGSLDKFNERAIQFGEGNFLRGFVDWMLDVMNEKGLFQGSVAVIQPIRQSLVDVLDEQDGLYTLLLRGIEQGQLVETRRLISVICRGINPYDDFPAFLAAAHNPELRFVFSNTTEAGIAYLREPFAVESCPESFPAKVARFLYERYQHFNGNAEKGLIFFPCELIDRNGDQLRKTTLENADDWNLDDDFLSWVENHNVFLNTLVDRIVPGFPSSESKSIFSELGYRDRLLDTCETYHLWVIEGPDIVKKELPLHEAGLNVVWTDNLEPYRTRKVRVLNGAHTSCVLAAFLSGLETVCDMMKNADFVALVERAVYQEILPSIETDPEEKNTYADSVVERFKNPFIRHLLLDISLNSVSKWKVRVLPSYLDYVDSFGVCPPVLSFSLAALIRFYRITPDENGVLTGKENNVTYAVKDAIDVLSFFARQWNSFASHNDAFRLVRSVLANEDFWGRDLNALPGCTDMVAGFLRSILETGMRETVIAVVDQIDRDEKK